MPAWIHAQKRLEFCRVGGKQKKLMPHVLKVILPVGVIDGGLCKCMGKGWRAIFQLVMDQSDRIDEVCIHIKRRVWIRQVCIKKLKE